MKINKRQAEIVQIVDKEGKVLVSDLSKRLDISEVTIRKDLNLLSSLGILMREHGYAIKKNTSSIVNRLSIKYETKYAIAKKVASMIDLHETVLIGSGSTCALLAEEIARTRPEVTIITHSLYIAEHASKIGNNRIILLGGEYQKDAQVMVGSLVRNSVKNFYVEKIFLGTDGYVKNVGFMGSDTNRTDAIKAMVESARKVYILTDSSKFNKRGVLVQLLEHQVDYIITDKGIPADYKEYLEKTGIKTIIVD